MITVIDIRTQADYINAHLSGAIHLPIQEIERITSIVPDLNAPIMLYSNATRRADMAKAILEHNGYKNILNGGTYIELNEQFGVGYHF